MASRARIPTAPIEVALPSATAASTVDSRVDIALFRGDLLDAVTEYRDAAVADLRQLRKFDARRAESAVDARLVLRASVMLEGWGVKLARWVLEASATGRAQHGRASELFSACASTLDPSLHVLLNRSRVSGLVRRTDAAVAIGQCARHQRLFERLVEQSSAQALHEFNRFYWRPIHFAAAFGSELIVQTLLELGADPIAATGAELKLGNQVGDGIVRLQRRTSVMQAGRVRVWCRCQIAPRPLCVGRLRRSFRRSTSSYEYTND